MKLIAFQSGAGAHHGALLPDDLVLDFEHAACDLPEPDGDHAWLDLDSPCHAAAAELVQRASSDAGCLATLREAGAVQACSAVQLLAPVPRPGKVICIGLNYRDHAEESGMAIPEVPLVFSKFSTCVIGPGETIEIPEGSTETDYEAELGVVIGKRARKIDEATALDHVLGYVNINDVSARDFQFADGQWQRGKSCDTFCPMGEYIATKDELADPHQLRIQLHLNGETLQDSSTNQLIFNVPQVVAYLSKAVTLEPGDVIATGTPPGVGFARKPPIYLKDGDVCEVEIEGLGVLRNPVRG